jgi:hypothetical protein
MLALASPAWAHGRFGGRAPGSPGPAGFGRHAGEPFGIHHQDRIGRALPYHHMVGGRFTPAPSRIATGPGDFRGHWTGRGHGPGKVYAPGYGGSGSCGGYGGKYYKKDWYHNNWYYPPYSGYWGYSGYSGYGYVPSPPAVTVIVPERIVVTTPYYCGPCSIGFATEAIFLDHVRTVHRVPAEGLAASLEDVDGRSVFVGD